MKRALVVLSLLGLMLSPMMVSQAQAAPAKHHRLVKHHKNTVKKHHTVKHLARKQGRKVTA